MSEQWSTSTPIWVSVTFSRDRTWADRVTEYQRNRITRCVSVSQHYFPWLFSTDTRACEVWVGSQQLNRLSFHKLSLHDIMQVKSPLMTTKAQFPPTFSCFKCTVQSLAGRPFGKQWWIMIIFGSGHVFVAIIANSRRQRGKLSRLWM